ncbi:MAG: hypothetical protein AB2L09_08475 [Coriobacteriia bacterium]
MDLACIDDDRFRQPGSRYEDEEVVAIGVVKQGIVIDWSDEARVIPALWLPEPLFAKLASASLLGTLDVYKQSRLTSAESQLLSAQMASLAQDVVDSDVRAAAFLVCKRAQLAVDLGPGHALLVEGP